MTNDDCLKVEELEKISPNPPENCFVNGVIKNFDSKSIAVQCDCGNYHPILLGQIIWSDSLNEEELSSLKKGEKTYSQLVNEAVC